MRFVPYHVITMSLLARTQKKKSVQTVRPAMILWSLCTVKVGTKNVKRGIFLKCPSYEYPCSNLNAQTTAKVTCVLPGFPAEAASCYSRWNCLVQVSFQYGKTQFIQYVPCCRLPGTLPAAWIAVCANSGFHSRIIDGLTKVPRSFHVSYRNTTYL